MGSSAVECGVRAAHLARADHRAEVWGRAFKLEEQNKPSRRHTEAEIRGSETRLCPQRSWDWRTPSERAQKESLHCLIEDSSLARVWRPASAIRRLEAGKEHDQMVFQRHRLRLIRGKSCSALRIKTARGKKKTAEGICRQSTVPVDSAVCPESIPRFPRGHSHQGK